MAKIQGTLEVKDLFTVQEAAKKLNCGVATLWRRVKSGDLIAVKIGGRTYFPKSEINRIK